MKARIALIVLCLFVAPTRPVYSAQSAITEAVGKACMGDDKSRKQTEDAALADAKRMAVEFASTYLKSETNIKNLILEKDLLSAYAHAEVKLLQEPAKKWYKDPDAGDCLEINIKAEVIPDTITMERMAAGSSLADDPSAPLQVKAWADKQTYKAGEKIKFYIKGNKPFYARVIYKDAAGSMVQILPNPHRTEAYFNGGVIYEIPAGYDKFELEVSPPFGEENVIIYASSSPLGEISTEARGGIFQVKTKPADMGVMSRGIKLVEKTKNDSSGTYISKPTVSEFYEDKVSVKTSN